MYTTVSYDNLDTYLAGLAANTQDTPYEIEISPVTEAFLHGGSSTSQGTLQYVLHNNATKYVSLKFDVPAELTTASSMLEGCKALISVDVSGMSRVTDTHTMFGNCNNLATVILPNMASVTRAHSMFANCLSLTSVDVSGMSRVTDTHTMFGNCNNLATVILPTMAGVTDAAGMFALCYSLTTIDVSGMTSVTDASSMFQDCGYLTSVDVSGMTSARNTRWMFSSCSSLENISLPTMTNVSQAGSMFKNCTRLTEIHGWSVPPTADMTDCFSGCTALEAIYVPEPSPSESSWRAWDIRKDTANNQSTVTVYNPDGTSNSVSVPSAGTYTMKVTDKVDELLFSPSEEIPAATIQKMLQTKAPITAKDALDPTKDNFMLLAKDRSSARTNVTTDVIEAGNKLPPTSEAVRAAIGSVVPVDIVEHGNMSAVTSNAVSISLSYSTEETLTGGTWIDGKPIYRKVWTGTYNVGRYTDILPEGLIMISITGYVKYSQDNGTRYWVINAPQNSANNVFFASVWYNDVGFTQFEVQGPFSGNDCAIIFEYAKTTD